MFLFDFLFGKRAADTGSATRPDVPAVQADAAAVEAGQDAGDVAPGTRIHYHPDLVARLIDDHHKLLAQFGAIRKSAAAGDMLQAAVHLDAFRVELQGHLLTENIRFYVYLEHALASDAGSHALMREFRHEMDGIGKAVVTFLGKYRELAGDKALAATFVDDLDAVGKVLVERIRREEETLYPLYLPAAAVAA